MSAVKRREPPERSADGLHDPRESAVDPLDRWRRALFAAGVAIALVMVWRAQIELDQYVLAVRGWMLVREGWLVPFGALTAAGGFQPGALTSLLMGAPLLVWEDYRAIGLLTLASHVVAYLLLDRIAGDVLGRRGRLLLCVVYWLNPWRIFYSAHIWNPNLVFLPAAVHLATAYRSRRRASFWHTFGHVVAVGVAFHLHASFLVLAIASLLLFVRGFVRVHWGGLVAGTAVVAATLANWVVAALHYPGILPISNGSVGKNLIQVLPVLEGVLYWLRYPTAACSSKLLQFDFGPALGEGWSAVLAPLSVGLVRALGPPSLGVALAANIWLWRRRGGRFGRLPERAPALDWLGGYSRWVLVGLAVVLALNPAAASAPTSVAGTTSWRGFIALHAAALPVVLWLGLLWRTAARRQIRVGVIAYGIALVLSAGAMSLAAPMYRKGGVDSLRCVVGAPHEMHEVLGIRHGATLIVDPERGFTSELLAGRRSLQRPPPFPRM